MEFLGNRTEETVDAFLKQLDELSGFNPEPILGVNYDVGRVKDILECSEEFALELFSKPVPFKYDEFDQVYVEDLEGNRFYLDSDENSPEFIATCDLVTDSLPDVPFDLDCGGRPSKQKETISLYKAIVFNSSVEGFYTDEIKSILNNYDYEIMTDSKGNYAFTNLVQRMQEEATPIEKVILMCLSTKCSVSKLKKDVSYRNYLKEEDSEQLKIILEKEANLNATFDKFYNKAESPKEKFSLGEKLAQERKKLYEEANKSVVLSLAYQVHKLEISCVPGRKMRKIRYEAESFLRDLVSRGVMTDSDSIELFKKKLISRAARLYLLRMKQVRFKLIAQGERNPDVLIPKS